MIPAGGIGLLQSRPSRRATSRVGQAVDHLTVEDDRAAGRPHQPRQRRAAGSTCRSRSGR